MPITHECLVNAKHNVMLFYSTLSAVQQARYMSRQTRKYRAKLLYLFYFISSILMCFEVVRALLWVVKSFHFWPRLRPASHRYQKSGRARQRASIHISIPFSIVGHGEEFMPPEPVIIFATRESHCSSLRSSILFRGERRGEKSDDALGLEGE